MSIVCPISFQTVDHNASRMTCGLTIGALGGFALTGSPVIALPLLLDYTLRAWTDETSPMQAAAFSIARAVGLQELPSGKAPKQFAARIGWLFALATVFLMFSQPAAAVVVAVALGFFNLLDGVFDFCVGCWTYTYLVLPLQERIPAIARLVP